MPSRSKALQWAAAVAAALAAHSLLLLGYARLGGYGAAGEGEGGIEIGLGLLGNMGEARVDSDAREIAERAPDPEPRPPEAPQPQPQPQPQAAAPAPQPVQQLTEVAVQIETSELVAELRRNEPELAPVENTPSEGGAGGDAAVTQRRRSTGTGDADGAGGSAGRRASYAAQLAAQLNRYKHYPMAARRARQTGTVTLLLVIRPDGSIANFSISESSGWDALDAAVLRMLERAQPLPPFPASMKEESFRVRLPVSFSLNPL